MVRSAASSRSDVGAVDLVREDGAQSLADFEAAMQRFADLAFRERELTQDIGPELEATIVNELVGRPKDPKNEAGPKHSTSSAEEAAKLDPRMRDHKRMLRDVIREKDLAHGRAISSQLRCEQATAMIQGSTRERLRLTPEPLPGRGGSR